MLTPPGKHEYTGIRVIVLSERGVNMPRTYGYNQQQLCDAIFAAVATASEPLSRLEIAQAIGLKKAPHIINMIEHLVAHGYFERSTGEKRKSLKMFVYRLAPGVNVDSSDACGA